MKLQPHIKCKEGDISKYVLLPGDPGRVLKIAEFLENPKKVSENREFLTYRGNYKGLDITVTSTGIGCPSAAIAVEELANIGAEVFVRIGTCGVLKEGINYGDVVIPTAAVRAEGTTKEYIEPEFPAVADLDVVNSLISAAKDNNFTYQQASTEHTMLFTNIFIIC
jgi:uridine phosphorylase